MYPKVFPFANSKCRRYFYNRLKLSKLTLTAMYRKQHKKDITQEAVKKRRSATKKPYFMSIVDATLEVIQKKRTEKPDAAREAALREIKERTKKTKDEKKAKKAEVAAKTQKSQGKGNVSKDAMPKCPKLGGGGGKRRV
ncbi:60S ribosomal protein L24 [Spatholobus suberectus]|nr:60S ribosomal protein L24 [Spatholobus suberectus]